MKGFNKVELLKIVFLTITVLIIPIMPAYAYVNLNPEQTQRKVYEKIADYYPDQFIVSAGQNGLISVNGETRTLFDKLRITDLISEVEGVQKIDNKIIVNAQPAADEMIKENITEDLQRNNIILEPEKIGVSVKSGVVYLSGSVNSFREKLMAQSIASWQDGVTDMISDIKILPSKVVRSDSNLEEIINDILTKHFPLEKNIKFSLKNGKVTLSGDVTNLYAKTHLPEEIEQVIGIENVVTNLSVKKYNYL